MMERNKGRKEEFGWLVLQVGNQHEAGDSLEEMGKGCTSWVEEAENRNQFRPSLKSAG